jgi:hypothetical protein
VVVEERGRKGYWVGECWDTTIGGSTIWLNDRLEKNGNIQLNIFVDKLIDERN